MNIYIPTYRRMERQHTWTLLSDFIRNQTVLVVHPDELDEHHRRGRAAIACSVQGSIAKVRKWIIDYALSRGEKLIGILDDDLIQLRYTLRPRDHIPGLSWYELADHDIWRDALQWVDDQLIHHVTCSWGTAANPPVDLDSASPWRGMHAHFFNLDHLPVNHLDFTGIAYAEDFHLILQLIRLGYPNIVSHRYRILPAPTAAPGGCQAQGRDRDTHNAAMLRLIETHKPWVTQSNRGRQGAEDWIKVTIRWQAYWRHMKESLSRG